MIDLGPKGSCSAPGVVLPPQTALEQVSTFRLKSGWSVPSIPLGLTTLLQYAARGRWTSVSIGGDPRQGRPAGNPNRDSNHQADSRRTIIQTCRFRHAARHE